MTTETLTREQIIGLKDALLGHHIPPCTQGQWRYVCDLALRALDAGPQDEPALNGPFASTFDLAKELGASDEEAMQIQTRVESIAIGGLQSVPDLKCPNSKKTCSRPTCDECLPQVRAGNKVRCFFGLHVWSFWEPWCSPGLLHRGEERHCYRCGKKQRR